MGHTTKTDYGMKVLAEGTEPFIEYKNCSIVCLARFLANMVNSVLSLFRAWDQIHTLLGCAMASTGLNISSQTQCQMPRSQCGAVTRITLDLYRSTVCVNVAIIC